MNQQLIEALKSKEDKMIEIRRYLHQHPEQNYLFMKMKRRNTSLNFTKVKMWK